MFSGSKDSVFKVVNVSGSFSLDLSDEFFNNTDVNQTDSVVCGVNSDKVIEDNIIVVTIIMVGIFIVAAVGVCMFWLHRNESVLLERYMRCAQNPGTLKTDQSSTSGATFYNTANDEVELQQTDIVELRQRKVEEEHLPQTLMSSPSNYRECAVYSPSNLS